MSPAGVSQWLNAAQCALPNPPTQLRVDFATLPHVRFLAPHYSAHAPALALKVGVSIGSLVVTESQQEKILQTGWCKMDVADKATVQRGLDCFGFDNETVSNPESEPACMAAATGEGSCSAVCAAVHDCTAPAPLLATASLRETCTPCYTGLADNIQKYLKRGGGIGLAFAFTEVGGTDGRN